MNEFIKRFIKSIKKETLYSHTMKNLSHDWLSENGETWCSCGFGKPNRDSKLQEDYNSYLTLLRT